MDRSDGEVVGVPREVLPDVRLPRPVVGQLDTEPDRHALRPPALGGLPDHPLAVLERGVPERRRAGLEVDVIGDRELGDPAFERGCGVDVDHDVAVGREVRVEVGVERQVARLTVDHVRPSGGNLSR